MKNDSVSERKREFGIILIERRLYFNAISTLNFSLCYAKSDEQFKSVLQTRAQAYSSCGLFKFEIKDMFISQYTELNDSERQDFQDKHNALSEIQKNLIKKDVADFFKLSHKKHEKIPFIINKIQVNSSNKYGNFLIAQDDINTGDIIAMEKPFVIFLKNNRNMRCSFCLKHNYLNLMPCESCVNAMWCSDACNSQHKSHRTFCRHQENSLTNDHDTSLFEICTEIMLEGVESCGSFKEFFEILTRPSNTTIFDCSENDPKSYFKVIASLARSEKSKISLSEGMKTLFKIYPYTCYWKTNEDLNDVVKCFEIIINIVNTNLLELGEYLLNSKTKKIELASSGGGICLFGSLFNHSCDPNVTRIIFDDKIVFVASRPIYAGDQLFISYGYNFLNHDYEERQKGLEKYNFECDCNACINSYSSIQNLPKKFEDFNQPNFGEISYKSAIEEFKKNCKLIQNNQNLHPCYELGMLMFHNNHLLHQIGTLLNTFQ